MAKKGRKRKPRIVVKKFAKKSKLLGQIMKQSYKTVKNLSEEKLTDQYRYLRRLALNRAKTFEKHGAEDKLPKWVDDLEVASKLSPMKMLALISNIKSWFRGLTSTFGGYQRMLKKRRSEFEDRIGYKFKDMDQYEEFMRSLGDLQDRYKEVWKNISDVIIDSMVQGLEVGLDIDSIKELVNKLLDREDDGSYGFENKLPKNIEDMLDDDSVSKLKLGGLRKWLDKMWTLRGQ